MKKNRFDLRNLGRVKRWVSLFNQDLRALIRKIIMLIISSKEATAEDLRKIGANGIGVGLFGLFIPKTNSLTAASIIMILGLVLWLTGLHLGKSANKED